MDHNELPPLNALYYHLIAWHIIVQGFHKGAELDAVVHHAKLNKAPHNSLYYDFGEYTYITTDTLKAWRYANFLELLHKYRVRTGSIK